MKEKIIKSCIGLKESNADLLDQWSEETGLSKNTIINLLIEDMKEHPRPLTVRFSEFH